MIELLWPAFLIFVLRVIDVSLGTLRIILTIQGRRTLAAAMGFVEVSIFITAVATVVQGALEPLRILAYGGGFAAGTFLGVTIDRRLALGQVVVRVITKVFEPLRETLIKAGFGVTLVEGKGGRGTVVGVVYSLCQRRRMSEILRLISSVDPHATVTVQEIRHHYHGYFSPKVPAFSVSRPVADGKG